jgi:alpha-mannosidase
MVLSRNQPGLYWWEAPDGSRVLTLSFYEGSYGHLPVLKPIAGHVSPLDSARRDTAREHVPPTQIASTLIPLLERWAPYFEAHKLPRIFLITATADYAVPEKHIREFIERWNDESERNVMGLPFPVQLKFGNVEQYIQELQRETDFAELDVMRGELPNPWIYIHGPCHAKTVDAMRQAQSWLVAAEALEVISGCPDPGGRYDLERAWLAHLYPDHGYGGVHGEGTDELFRQKEEEAAYTARAVALGRMNAIASRTPARADDVRTLVVFNISGAARSDWVEKEVFFEPEDAVYSVELLEQSGSPVQIQVLEIGRGSGGELRRLRIGFIARDLQSFGQQVYRLIRTSKELPSSQPSKLNGTVAGDYLWENAHHRVRITRGGLVELFDKRSRRNLLSPDYYLGCEVVEMGSPGHDVGEGERDVTNYIWDGIRPFQPVALDVERTADLGSQPVILEDGPLRKRVRTESQFSHCRVIQTFTLYWDLDRIEASVEIRQWSGVHGRELRLMFPVGEPTVEISYDTPFGVAIVGKTEVPGFADLRPREAQSWIHAGGKNTRITVASSVIAHDWKDPLNTTDRPVLQAILLATKRSCHPKGPWYTQEGNHSFYFAISGAPASVSDRMRFGAALSKSMDVVARKADSPSSVVETPDSWVSIDAANAMISSLRLLDNGASAAVRCWECEGNAIETTLRFGRPVREVVLCDALDHERAQVWVSEVSSRQIPIQLSPYEIVTLKVRFAE